MNRGPADSFAHPGSWARSHGPVAALPWLDRGELTEPIPSWFAEFFLASRDVGTVAPAATKSCTMTTLEDNWCLYRLIEEAKPNVTLEIGIMRGSSSITIGRAIDDSSPGCRQIALDIDPLAVDAVQGHFANQALNPRLEAIVADSRTWLPASRDRWQFAFLDGDHSFNTVAFEFAEVFNRCDPGGWIVLHDTGSVRWGVNKDPGHLFFNNLDSYLGDSGAMTWLDSTACGADMKLRTSCGFHDSLVLICQGLAGGYGGMGIVQKLNDEKRLNPHELIGSPPAVREPAKAVTARRPLAGRVLRRLARYLDRLAGEGDA